MEKTVLTITQWEYGCIRDEGGQKRKEQFRGNGNVYTQRTWVILSLWKCCVILLEYSICMENIIV